MKTAVITGASKGIGECIARAFLANGFNVIANYRTSGESALKLKKELGSRCEIFRADVSDYEQVCSMFDFAEKKFGKVTALVNNAGICLPQSVVQDVSSADFERICAVNLKGVFNCCKRAIDGMVSAGGGAIVNVSSIWGQVGGSCEAVYSMTKAGVIGFTKALAKELAPSNITVNAVAPGFINTDMNAGLTEEARAAFLEEVPLGRAGTPEEVAAAVLFLAKAGYCTGQILGVNGGYC